MADEMSALSETDREAFEAVLDTILNAGKGDLALMRCALDGKEVAVIAAVSPSLDGGADLSPMAILVAGNEDLFNRLTPPADPDLIAEAEVKGG